MADAATISMTVDGQPAVTVRPDNIARAIAALGTCERDLLQRWNVDPTEQDAIAQPPRAIDPVSFITPDDYPMDALSGNVQGTSIILFGVGPNGRVMDCRIAVTSGSASLDAASCNAVKRRGRYHPAIGKDGKPMLSHQVRQVNWRLP